MKLRLFVPTLFIFLLAPVAWAQSAAFTQGTNNLANTNLLRAYTNFASAVAVSPTDPEANVYYAMTRVLALPSLPAGNSFLNQAGFSTVPRDLYKWPVRLPGKFPSAFNGDALTAQFLTNVLPALIAAQTNLAQITDTGFTMNLPNDVTHLSDVTIDYGDVQMIRAMLDVGAMYIYVLNSWNLNATIGSVSNIISTDKSIEAVLTNYPSLLTFATTGNKGLAQAAFTNAADRYFAASDWIRNNRAAGETFLFNLSANEQPKELDFRKTLTNLLVSVSGSAQPLPTGTNISISMKAFFSDSTSPRQLLPQFQSGGSAFIWDSWPDVTLGGVISGLSQSDLDKAAHKKLEAALDLPGASLKLIGSAPNDGGNLDGVIYGKDGNLYGAEQYGGAYSGGIIFKMVPSTGKTTILHEFGEDTNSDSDGASPNTLIQGGDGYLYGTTQEGGTNDGGGTIFRVGTGGGNTFKTLYTFGATQDNNSYGPAAALAQDSAGNLYGTTSGTLYGGTQNAGTIFKFSPTSLVFNNLHSFQGPDGASPESPLIRGKDGNLYGVAYLGGANNDGCIFEISPTGANFVDLYDFGSVQDPFGDQVDGALPTGLAQGADGAFYGMTFNGGTNDSFGGGDGTIFSFSTTTGALTTLFNFDEQDQDGFNPIGSLIEAANGSFYGVTSGGGANNVGSVFGFKTNGSPTSAVWFTKDGGTGGFSSYQYGEYGYESPPESPLIQGADGNFYGVTDKEVYELSISSSQAPRIISQPPNSQTINAGSVLTIQAAAAGTAPLTYQWYFNGNKISGENTATLTVKNVAAANSGGYEVVVNNSSGSVTSSVDTVTVLVPPAITSQPVNQNVPTNGVATFSVKATGSPLTYLWFFDGQPLSDGNNISGSAGNQLTIRPALAGNVGSYSVVVSNASSGATVNSAVVQLTLVSEKTKPSVAILSPKAGSRANAPTLSGAASDSVGVQAVAYWVTNLSNGGTTSSGLAILSGGTNWTIPAGVLRPGTNTLAVQSSNYSALSSSVAKVSFFYQETAPLQLQTSGSGGGQFKVKSSVAGESPNLTGLYIGEAYQVTATASNGSLFTGWTEVTTNTTFTANATVSFVMETNVSLTASFETNIYLVGAGTYNGLFSQDTNEVSELTAGFLGGLIVGTNGSYSGKLWIDGASPSISGAFTTSSDGANTYGSATNVVVVLPAKAGSAGSGVNATVEMRMDAGTNPPYISGTVSVSFAGADSVQPLTSTLMALRAGTNWPAAEYTMLIPPGANAPPTTTPGGYGYALITNAASSAKSVNMAAINGALADGSTFSQTVAVSEDGSIPFYDSLYSNKGLLLGWINLTNMTGSGLTWIHPKAGGGLYTNGFATVVPAGEIPISPWIDSPTAISSLANTLKLLTISYNTNSAGFFAPTVKFTNSLILSGAGGLAGSINPKTGLLQITFGPGKTNGYGAILQNATNGGGYFLIPAAGEAGAIQVQP